VCVCVLAVCYKLVFKSGIRKEDEAPHGIGFVGPVQDVIKSKNDSLGFRSYHKVPKRVNYSTFSGFSLSSVLPSIFHFLLAYEFV